MDLNLRKIKDALALRRNKKNKTEHTNNRYDHICNPKNVIFSDGDCHCAKCGKIMC